MRPRHSPSFHPLGSRCGRGWLFNGPLQANERCDHYDLDLSPHDTGGGAAVFVIPSLGTLVVSLAIWLEAVGAQALLVQLLVWLITIIVFAVALLWTFKGILMGLHLKNLQHKTKCLKMADRQPFRLNFWMTVCAIPVLMLLTGLGTWQMQRLEWKEGIIAERAVRQAAPPVRISGIPKKNWQEYEYRRVTLRGIFLHSREILVLNAIRHGQTGYRLVVPFQTTDGQQILVDRGWVPKVWPNGQIERRRPGNSLDLIGTVRSGGKGTPWIPDNDPATDQWFYIDVSQMAAHAGLKDSPPYILSVTPDRREPGYPKGPHASHRIRNKHLEYAITWYGLAATLVIVYVAYHFRRRRQGD